MAKTVAKIVGNRERLLAGARQCLLEKGYTRTTARDIATAAGVSLAAIGYHFRTTQALLNAALQEAVADWGAELDRALADASTSTQGETRFEAVWTRVIESFPSHRPLWAAQFEIIGQVEQSPEIRELFADGHQQGRLALAGLFDTVDPDTDPEQARLLGTFYQALLAGVMTQYLMDPAGAPSARDLSDALKVIAAKHATPGSSPVKP